MKWQEQTDKLYKSHDDRVKKRQEEQERQRIEADNDKVIFEKVETALEEIKRDLFKDFY